MSIYIVMGIVLELLQNEKITAQKLAQKYELSTRSIYRYVNALCESGFPIITHLGRMGGIALEPNFSLNNLFFTKSEIELLISLCMKKKNKTPESQALCEKLKYIKMNKYLKNE